MLLSSRVSADMAKKITTCLLVPLVFVVSVIGLFFASTDPSTWPQKTTYLGASDTELMTAVSTVWCESVVLTSSEHDFLAYKLSETPVVNPLSLRRQVLELRTKLDRRRLNKLERTFYLLPGSVIRIMVCATDKQAHLHVYRGTVNRECFDFAKQQSSESDESDEYDSARWTVGYGGDFSNTVQSKCPPAIKSEDVPVSHKEYQSMDCMESGAKAININVTSPGNYAIILTHDGFGSNDVRLRLILDRASYQLEGEGHSAAMTTNVQMCGIFSPCVVPLTFASRERILLSIPPEPDAGKTTYAIRSQCRPRIAVFAFLIVLLPVMLFVIVAFVLRGKSRRSARYQAARRQLVATSTNPEGTQWGNVASPLLPSAEHSNNTVTTPSHQGVPITRTEGVANSQCCFEGDPPPYDCIFGIPPPSYSSLNPSPQEAAPQP